MSLAAAVRLPDAGMPPRGRSITMRSREPMCVAPLVLDDAPKFQRFVMRLDRNSLRCRFGHEVGTEAIRAHAVRALTDAVWIFGVSAGGDLRGVVELYTCADRRLEVALVVEQGWRRRGLAWALLRHAMRAGREGRCLHLMFARDNWPMRALAMKANARIDLVFDEMCAEIDITRRWRHA